MKAEDAKKALERRYKKQNEYLKGKYDRINAVLPKGTKERIKAVAPGTISAYLTEAILEKLDRDERAAQDPGQLDPFTDLESPAGTAPEEDPEELPFPED